MTLNMESGELAELRSLIAPTAERLSADGHRLFFVGGIVRDLILAADGVTGVDFSDVDLTTDARPKAIKAAIGRSAEAMWTQGERFGTIGAMIGDHAFEITTHRAESYDETSRKPVVSFGDDLDVDLSRRDFTINAMAIEVTTGLLRDPYGGRNDLEERRLRTPLDPSISFTDDPLRMLRAARFIPRFGLVPAPELVDAARDLRDRLGIVSGERIHDELEKLLELDDPSAGLSFLLETGLLEQLGLAAAGPSIARIAATSTARARRAGLLFTMDRDEAHAFLTALRYSNLDRRSTERVLSGVRQVLDAWESTAELQADRPDAIRRLDPLLRSLAALNGDDAINDVAELLPLAGFGAGAIAAFQAAVADLRGREDLDDRSTPLDGAEIMRLLGISPGPAVGAAVAHLESCRLNRGPLTADEARAELRLWAPETS